MLGLFLIVAACLGAGASAQSLDAFESGVTGWLPEMQYGKVDGCKVSSGPGAKGGNALRIDFDLAAEGTNHIIFAKKLSADLSLAEGLSFDVKGAGDSVMVFVFLWDGAGRHVAYGPNGTNTDFRTGYADWRQCKLSFDKDKPAEGSADLSDIRRVGFMINDAGPKKGTAWFDNLSAVQGRGRVRLSSTHISPNGDGFRDRLDITAVAPRGTRFDLRVYDSAGKLVTTLLRDATVDLGKTSVHWDGRHANGKLQPGRYTVRADFQGKEKFDYKASVVVENAPKCRPLNYTAKPFFPIGAWFEGNPSWGSYPSDPSGARRYYDRCFADLVAHGFNTVTVPNCPEQLWDTLLQSAEKNRIKVVLEVRPLVDLVISEPVSESQVQAAVKRIHAKIGKYASLLRYQIRDEPAATMVPNWLLVQRVLGSVDPSRPAFSCFCSRDALLSVTERTKLSEAVFDIYPLWQNTPAQTLGGFLPSLDAFKEASAGYTPWPVLQSFEKPNAWRYPTPEELRAMTYLSLTAGAKGMFYFIYQTLPDHPERLRGLVDAKGKSTPLYEATAELARELGKLSPILLSLKVGSAQYRVQGDARVGAFADSSANPVIIVASTRPDTDQTVRINGAANGSYHDALTGETFEAANGALEIKLGPGRGRVLVKQ